MTTKQFNRRDFIKTATVASTALAIGAGATTANATPKRGGTLRVAMGSGASTNNFDPRTFASSVQVMMGRIFANQLTRATDDGKLEGDLAKSWQQSQQGTVWDLELRKGIKFHNGKEFTANDAVYSLKIHADKNSKSGAYGYLSDWKSIEKTSKYSIRITLNKANQDLPWILNDYHLIMLPDGFTGWNNKPIGTGPYILESFNPGEKMIFNRNPEFHRPNSAWYDKVIVLSILDATTRQNALLSGQVDIIDTVTPSVANLLERNSNFDLVLSTTGMYYVHNMDTSKSPFNNNDFRLAIKNSLDRNSFVKNVLNGFGVAGNDQPIASGNEFFNPNIIQYNVDLDRAKYHLKKSGLNNTKISLSTSIAAYGAAIDAAAIVQESLGKAGIKIDIAREAADGYWSNVWMKKPFVTSYWGASPTAALTFTRTYHSKASWNDTRYFNDRLDFLIDEMNGNPNYDSRKSACWEAQAILHNDGGQLIPAMPQSIDAKSTKVQGMKPHPIYEMHDFRVAEKTWFA